jgi:hypothetical protein
MTDTVGTFRNRDAIRVFNVSKKDGKYRVVRSDFLVDEVWAERDNEGDANDLASALNLEVDRLMSRVSQYG